MNKKYTLWVIFMIFALMVNAQSKKKKSKQKPAYTIGISSGYFSHGKMFENSENDFSSFGTFQIEGQKLFKSKKTGLSLGYFSAKSDFTKNNITTDESRFALMLNYNLMYNILKSKNTTGLYVGGFLGALYDQGKQLYRSNFAFPFYTTYVAGWLGPKAEYLYQINPKIALSACSQFGLVEFGKQSNKRDDPNLPKRNQTETYVDFAKRINLNLGITFTL